MGWQCSLVDARTITGIVFDENIVIEPPKPIKKTEYYCDKRFHIESIVDLFAAPDHCGLIFINGENCELYTVDVSNCDRKKSGNAQTRLKQHKKGGQSQQRFGRLHDAKVKGYLKEIAEESREVFGDTIDKIVIAGISTRPAELVKYLHTDVAKKVIGTIVMTATSDFNSEVIPKLEQLIQAHCSEKETAVLAEFVYDIAHDLGKAVYGTTETATTEGLSKLYCDYSTVTPQLQTEAETTGTELIAIGKSLRGQELIATYGSRFGLRWY